jgi:hypothetical protein
VTHPVYTTTRVLREEGSGEIGRLRLPLIRLGIVVGVALVAADQAFRDPLAVYLHAGVWSHPAAALLAGAFVQLGRSHTVGIHGWIISPRFGLTHYRRLQLRRVRPRPEDSWGSGEEYAGGVSFTVSFTGQGGR